MRRRGLACLTIALGVTGFTACDTNDGREMEPPSSYARFDLQNTAPSTAPTTTPLPTEVAVTTSSTSTTTTTTTTTVAPSTSTSTSVAASSTTTAGSQPAGSAEDAGAASLGFPDLAEQGVQFAGPWEPGAAIDISFTCDGEDNEPLITWTAPPEGTAELAFAVVDESTEQPYVHWLVIRLPAEAGSLGGGEPLAVGTEAINSSGEVGWVGPCPPSGSGPHTYRFTLYALSQALELPADTPPAELLTAIEGVTVAVATFTGEYEGA